MNAIFRYLLFGLGLFVGALLVGCGSSETGQSVAENDTQPETSSTADTPSTKTPSTKTPPAKAPLAAKSPASKSGMGGMKKMTFPAPADMKFKDNVDSNSKAPENVGDLVFTNPDGSKIKLSDYKNKKNVMLVFTEGFNGMLCPFCQTQTSRLVSNYDEFKERDCEVIVVYPGSRDHLDEFVEAALKTEKAQVDQVPFPIVLDADFTATKYFEIESKLAHPSTYLIDKQGGVQFAYVGNDMSADRPSIKAMLQRLDKLKE